MPLNYPNLYKSSKEKDQQLCDILNQQKPDYFRETSKTKAEDGAGIDIILTDKFGVKVFVDSKYVGAKTGGFGRKYIEVYEVIDPEYIPDYIWYIVNDTIYVIHRWKLYNWVNENRDRWEIDKRQPTIMRKHDEVDKWMMYLNSYDEIPGIVKFKNPLV